MVHDISLNQILAFLKLKSIISGCFVKSGGGLVALGFGNGSVKFTNVSQLISVNAVSTLGDNALKKYFVNENESNPEEFITYEYEISASKSAITTLRSHQYKGSIYVIGSCSDGSFFVFDYTRKCFLQ